MGCRNSKSLDLSNKVASDEGEHDAGNKTKKKTGKRKGDERDLLGTAAHDRSDSYQAGKERYTKPEGLMVQALDDAHELVSTPEVTDRSGFPNSPGDAHPRERTLAAGEEAPVFAAPVAPKQSGAPEQESAPEEGRQRLGSVHSEQRKFERRDSGWSIQSFETPRKDSRSPLEIFEEALNKPEHVSPMPTRPQVALGALRPTPSPQAKQNEVKQGEAKQSSQSAATPGQGQLAGGAATPSANKNQPAEELRGAPEPSQEKEDRGIAAPYHPVRASVDSNKLTREEEQLVRSLRKFASKEDTITDEELKTLWTDAGEADVEVGNMMQDMLDDLRPIRKGQGDLRVVDIARFLAETPAQVHGLTQAQQDMADHLASFAESSHWITEQELKRMWDGHDSQGLANDEVEMLLDGFQGVVKCDNRGRYSIEDLARTFGG